MADIDATGKWRYSINYGPDGEEDWANLITPTGEHVANIRTRHAKAIVDALTRPSDAGVVGVKPVCPYCKGTGQEVEYVGLEMKPFASTCSHCNGEGFDPDAALIPSSAPAEAEPVAWRYRSGMRDGAWLLTGDANLAINEANSRNEVQPLYASPPPALQPDMGWQSNESLDRDEQLAITEHLMMLADIDTEDANHPACDDLCGNRLCDQIGCVVDKYRRTHGLAASTHDAPGGKEKAE